MVGVWTDVFAWLVVLAFGAGAGYDYLTREADAPRGSLGAAVGGDGRRVARAVTTGAWGLFAAFWLVLFPHFAFEQKSYVEGVLALVAVPACAYAGYLLWRGRDSLFVLSRAVAIMGLVYLPFETIPAVAVAGVTIPAPRRLLIETVAHQTGYLIHLLGYDPALVVGPESGYRSAYQFRAENGRPLIFEIVLACTGLGSIAIFVGLVGAVRAPLGRKLRALAIAVPVIYALNLARTTFIGVAFGDQLLHVYPDVVLFLFGAEDEYLVSWFVADRIISQLLAVVALVGVTYLVVRELPEVLVVVEDVLYMVTGEEYDLSTALDVADSGPDGVDEVRSAG